MRVLISGASGLVGRALTEALKAQDEEVCTLVRRRPDESKGQVGWDPYAGVLDASRLSGFDAVVHLAGEPISERWTPDKKKRIKDSRARGTRMIAEVISQLPKRPEVFVSASAVGFYGDRGDEALTEQSAPGTGFLSEVCREWEAAAAPAREAGIRTVHLRTGIVLSAKGGVLARALPFFQNGLGGVVGSGHQWMSWISLDDEVAAIVHAIRAPNLSGPLNLTSPNPASNREFTQALGKTLGRPTFFPLPGFVVQALWGEMGRALLLQGQKAFPKALLFSGFRFAHPDLEDAVRFELAR